MYEYSPYTGNRAGRYIMHGLSRAAITKLQGGRWSSGFWSGFAASGFSVGTKGYGGFVGRSTIMAIVGGTVDLGYEVVILNAAKILYNYSFVISTPTPAPFETHSYKTTTTLLKVS